MGEGFVRTHNSKLRRSVLVARAHSGADGKRSESQLPRPLRFSGVIPIAAELPRNASGRLATNHRGSSWDDPLKGAVLTAGEQLPVKAMLPGFPSNATGV